MVKYKEEYDEQAYIFFARFQEIYNFQNPSAHANPMMSPREVQFDSNYDSGNCKRVYQLKPYMFGILMREDTNTRGYFYWFNFKV